MISILLPTRKRVDKLKDMMTTAMATAGAPIELVVYYDQDDKETETFLKERVERVEGFGHHLRPITGEAGLLSRYWNDCAEAATGDVLQMANDDILYKTGNWAVEVEAAFEYLPKKIGMVHVNNEQGNAQYFATHPFVHRRWLEAVGYFVPQCFAGDYADTWLWDIVNPPSSRVPPAKVIYLPNIKIEHRHYSVGKSAMDKTYQDRITMDDGRAKAMYDSFWPLRELAGEKLKEAQQ